VIRKVKKRKRKTNRPGSALINKHKSRYEKTQIKNSTKPSKKRSKSPKPKFHKKN